MTDKRDCCESTTDVGHDFTCPTMLTAAGITPQTPSDVQQTPIPAETGDGHEADGIWVMSDLTPTGVYVTTVLRGNRILATLDRSAALRWADAFTRQMAYARYDAAVIAQLKHVGLQPVHIGGMIKDLRQDRTPANKADTYPLVIDPIVSGIDYAPRLQILDGGGSRFVWDIDEAAQHVHQVLELSAVTDVDALYYRILKYGCGMDEGPARAVIGDLGHFRSDSTCTHRHIPEEGTS